MTTSLRSLLGHGSLALACALVLGSAGCGAPDDDGAAVQQEALGATPDRAHAILHGAWTLATSDLSPSSSYTINGDELDLTFGGYYTWQGTWASGYQGYTFTHPAHLVDGATYQLTLTVANPSIPVPVALKASLSGAGPEQSLTFFGAGAQTLTFTVGSCPGPAAVLDVVAHPVLGHIGPVEGTGILIQSYQVTASLVRTK